MTLLELLVKELPKIGGWPGSVHAGERMALANVHWSYGGEGCYPRAHQGPIASPPNQQGPLIRKEQYEAALAASNQPAWSGEGFPPVGCHCQYNKRTLPGDEWTDCTVDYVGSSFVVYRDCYGVELTGIKCDMSFRPIRTEAERRREDAETALRTSLAGTGSGITPLTAKRIYAAIAAGKIPGVKLEDA